MSAAENQSGKNENSGHARRAAQAAHETVERLAARGEAVEERLQDAKHEVEERVRRKAEQTRERGQDLADRAYDYVLEHPLLSLGAAFAAGVFLSSLNRRR